MQRHYRPRVNVVQRPTAGGGIGFEITGHHELMVPLLAWAVVEAMEDGGRRAPARKPARRGVPAQKDGGRRRKRER
jgi:hypothetical protein